MNRLHHWYCNRETWKRHVREELVPPAIAGIDLGDDVLEVGPGFGPATEVLAGRADRLTALEIDPVLAAPLRARLEVRPGAPLAGTDSMGRGLGFALLHIGDTGVLIDPDDLPRRLSAAGFEQVEVVTEADSFRFRALRPNGTPGPA